jgi:flagellar biosynthesis/type III secretory pathway protein FliH
MARVIRAEAAGTRVVPAVVVDAHERAQQLLVQAQEQVEVITELAVEQGRAEGRAELAAVLIEHAREHAQALATLERQAVDVALLAAKRIVGEALALEPVRIAEVVAPLFSRVRRARQVTLRVHPDDRGALEALLAKLCERAGMQAAVQVEVDAGMSRGGCVVNSDVGTLDARVETRLAALSRALEAQVSASDTAPAPRGGASSEPSTP